MLEKISLKAKILSLGCLVALSLVLLSWEAVKELSNFHDSTIEDFAQVEHNVEILADITNAHVIFKTQVQEWKNTLIRGNDAKQFKKYKDRFQKSSDKVQQLLTSAINKSKELNYDSQAIEQVRTDHAALKKSYLNALKNFDKKINYQGKKSTNKLAVLIDPQVKA